MNTDFVYNEDSFSNWKPKYVQWLLILVGVVTAVTLVHIKNRKRTVKPEKDLPGLALRFWHLFGHLHLSLRHRITFKKVEHSFHVYDFLMICGYITLFSKESVVNVWQFYKRLIIVYKAETVEMLLSHSTELQKAWFYDFLHPWLGTGLLTSHGSKWKQRRKLLTPAFHFNILKDFLPVFNKESEVLVGILKGKTDQKCIDIIPYVTKCSLDIICDTTLGVQLHAQTKAESEYVKAVLSLSDYTFHRTETPWLWPNLLFQFSSKGRAYWRSIRILHNFTLQVIADRKKEKLANLKQDDPKEVMDDDAIGRTSKKRALLDLLLEEHINNQSISESDIREEVDTFTFEGHDTTAMAMSWVLYLVGLSPEIERKIQDEQDTIFRDDRDRPATTDDLSQMKYLECVIKESLRLYPSVPFYARRVNEDIEYNGYKIPKGASCGVFTYMLHRDPEVFPNPEKFDPDRFLPENSAGRHPYAYVPFSAGPRNCIGQRFALMEEKTVLSTVFKHFHLKSLDPRDRIDLVDELILRPSQGLRVQIRSREKCVSNESNLILS